MSKVTIGIYKITSPSDKIYIGQSVNIERRRHRYSQYKCKKQIKLYNSLKKYGWAKHTFEIIEECDISSLNKRERYWQEFYNCIESGLNCRFTKTTDKQGYMSKESKIKLSIAHTGKTFSEEHKLKISKSKKGLKMSKKFKEMRREASLGNKNNFYNKKHSKKSRKLISKNRKGKLMKENNGRAVKLIDTATKEVYDCIKCAAEKLNIKTETLRSMLSGNQKNKTNLIYLKDFVVDDNRISDIM